MTGPASEFSSTKGAADPEQRYALELAGTPEAALAARRALVARNAPATAGRGQGGGLRRGPRFAPDATRSRPDETGGWGLVLVDRIADRWAVTRTATGTCVWFEIRYEA